MATKSATDITTNPFGGSAGASSDFWDAYMKGRPHLRESFLQRIWSYHVSKGGKFGVIHEPGAGAGVHSRRLAAKFSQIIVSDIDESNINIAKQHLKDLPNAKFRVGKLEDINDLPAEGVDMVVAFNCAHWADHDKLLEALKYQLRPGGTYVFAMFAPSILDNPRAHDLWIRLWYRGCEMMEANTGHKPFTSAYMRRVYKTGDAEGLPSDIFEPGAVRLKINHPGDWQFLIPEDVRAQHKEELESMVSRVGESDQIVVEDDEDWTFEEGLPRLKEMIDGFAPYAFDEDEQMRRYWKELEEVIGDGKVKGKYVVGAVMATKRH